MSKPDTLADLLAARLAVAAAERELEKLEPTDPGRRAAEALLGRACERYMQAMSENPIGFGLLLDSTENPLWSSVAERIDSTFEFGGSVRLHVVQRAFRVSERLLLLETISMEAEPGRFRLIVVKGERSTLRVWQEPGAPFRATEPFREDEWDSRTICADVTVAKSMFREFFDAKGITPHILEQTTKG